MADRSSSLVSMKRFLTSRLQQQPTSRVSFINQSASNFALQNAELDRQLKLNDVASGFDMDITGSLSVYGCDEGVFIHEMECWMISV